VTEAEEAGSGVEDPDVRRRSMTHPVEKRMGHNCPAPRQLGSCRLHNRAAAAVCSHL